jgi:hypothetical protein
MSVMAVPPPPSSTRTGEFTVRFRHTFRRRVWLVVVACVAGMGLAWLVVRGDPRIYERELTYVIRPAASLDDSAYGDALSTIDHEITGVEPTLLQVLGEPEFLARAVERVGSGEESNSLRATIRPGSNIIDVTLRSSDRAALRSLSTEVASRAEQWLDATYHGVYVLDPLLVTVRPDAVAPDVGHAIEVGFVIGAAAGVVLVFLETLIVSDRGPRGRSQRSGVQA